ncbi:hypothetical protein Vafri_17137 [Volvox africanus]|uniref:Glycosyl transferase CAP10 domain-containing protein n=1 Tax=Volvox africanus TaxID=51714 RepID=A0A8J4BJM7_9CHLO|nr:hypothetical protein Vafri_17137 [Volvox africanus]
MRILTLRSFFCTCILTWLCSRQVSQSTGSSLSSEHVWVPSNKIRFDSRLILSNLQKLPQTNEQREAAHYCTTGNFSALYDTIHRDLRFWWDTGITAKLMDWMLDTVYQMPVRYKGAGILFKDGKPYLITDPAVLNTTGHHQRLVAAHFALFIALSSTFGASIPDVEFLFSTADEPAALLHYFANGTNPDRLPPVLSFCKSPISHADVLVPDIHFFMRNFTAKLLMQADNFTSRWPWDQKTPKLFGRFAPYARAANQYAPELFRRGRGGKDICQKGHNDIFFCDVRKHYIWDWARKANKSGLPLDVAQQPKRDMMHHASFKWLLHLDGQTCSSRLEQLMVLGSLVVKEESGYEAFFHHIIQPYKHYLPFWKTFPEETKSALLWASQNDREAAAIASAAQQVALTYLHKRALMCYWLKVLQEIAALLRYTPGPDGGRRTYKHMVPLEEYMRTGGWRELDKHHLRYMEFWD